MSPLSQHLPNIRTRLHDKHQQIWCLVRRRWLLLTPEEVVRQTVILHLLSINYPRGWISIERKIKNHILNKRYDVIVANRHGEPNILVECKAMGEPLNQSTLDQITAYNYTVSSPILWITNGHENKIYQLLQSEELKILDSIPIHRSVDYLEEE